MAQPVVHFEICVQDAGKSGSFYSELFDWKINAVEGMPYSLVEAAGGSSIGGGIFQTDGKIPKYLTFYVQVDDLQAYLDRAERMGGKTTQPPKDIPGIGSSAMFADPDGHLVGLFKPQA